MSLYNRIKETAKERGILLKEIAEKIGTTAGNMTRWDENRPSVDKVVAVAQIFGVSVDYLVGLTDNKTPAGNTDGQNVELSARTEAVIQLLRAVPYEHLDFAYDLLEGSLEAIIRHLPIPAELQSSFRAGSDR